jgi:hypothetical protein
MVCKRLFKMEPLRSLEMGLISHTSRFLSAMNDGGAAALTSQKVARGNNRIDEAFRVHVVGLVTEHYSDFCSKFAAEKLLLLG